MHQCPSKIQQLPLAFHQIALSDSEMVSWGHPQIIDFPMSHEISQLYLHLETMGPWRSPPPRSSFSRTADLTSPTRRRPVEKMMGKWWLTNGNQWKAMETNGNQWKPMETNGNQWKPMETNGTWDHLGELSNYFQSHLWTTSMVGVDHRWSIGPVPVEIRMSQFPGNPKSPILMAIIIFSTPSHLPTLDRRPPGAPPPKKKPGNSGWRW